MLAIRSLKKIFLALPFLSLLSSILCYSRLPSRQAYQYPPLSLLRPKTPRSIFPSLPSPPSPSLPRSPFFFFFFAFRFCLCAERAVRHWILPKPQKYIPTCTRLLFSRSSIPSSSPLLSSPSPPLLSFASRSTFRVCLHAQHINDLLHHCVDTIRNVFQRHPARLKALVCEELVHQLQLCFRAINDNGNVVLLPD